MTIEDMAKAHLDTVKKAVQDLMAQRDKIESEINKLQGYIKTGENVINGYTHVNEDVTKDYETSVFRNV